MSAFAILDRRNQARRENLSKSKHNINEIQKQKEKQQYNSYINNVNTLNQMKKIFCDFYPVIDEQEQQEKEESGSYTQSANKPPMSLGSKKSQGKPGRSAAHKKRQMVKCIVNYERELK